jgi:hypothetical protein
VRQLRFAVLVLRAVDLRAVDLRPVDRRAVDFLAVDLRPVDFRAVDLRPVDRRAVVAVDLRPVDFRAVDLRPVDFRAVDLRAVDLRAVDLRPVDFRAEDLRATDFRAEDFLAPTRFLAVVFREAIDRLALRLRVAAAFFPAATRCAVDRFAVERREVLLFVIAIPFLLPIPLGRHPLEASALPFAHAPPHAVAFITAEGVVQALDAHGALTADPLGLPR